MTRAIRITHRPSGEVIAEGPAGFRGITSFEGNLYIRRKYLRVCPETSRGIAKFSEHEAD